ncbi:hypothetical protein F5887DRAFT_1242942 [Amanita rubescens]|nr:hypothetical protein F5887DRAFT_1242942 [Amanita rubescens]
MSLRASRHKKREQRTSPGYCSSFRPVTRVAAVNYVDANETRIFSLHEGVDGLRRTTWVIYCFPMSTWKLPDKERGKRVFVTREAETRTISETQIWTRAHHQHKMRSYIKRKFSNLRTSNSDPASDVYAPSHSSDSLKLTGQHESLELMGSHSNLDSANNTPPTSILAFRSITTMLPSLQGTGRMKLTLADNSDLPPEVRQELRILVALATILVRNHEVVSVVALEDELKSCFKQIACTRSISADNKEQPGLSQMDDVKPKTEFRPLFTIGNFQRDNNKTNGSLGVGTRDAPISAPISPAEGLDPGLKDQDLLCKLYVTHNAHIRTFDEHTVIISQIITNSKHMREMGLFQDYVLAACTPKIFNRLTHPKLSRPFICSLKAISSFEFKDAYPKGDSPDKALYDHIPSLALLFPGKIPNLYELCESTASDRSARLYTVDTCTEFHWLLCKLLEMLEVRLKELHDNRLQDPEKFLSLLRGPVLFGNALWAISRSGAVESHLKAIEAKLLLWQETADKGQERSGAGGGKIDGSGVEGGDDKPPLWMSYRDWLRLMVVHFDAVAIVYRHVTGKYFPYEGVSLRVIAPSPVDDKLLPWEELLRSQHFPGGCTEEIIKFLKDSKTKAKLIKTAVKSLHTYLRDAHLPPWHQLWNVLEPLQSKKGAEDEGHAEGVGCKKGKDGASGSDRKDANDVEDLEDPSIAAIITMARSLKSLLLKAESEKHTFPKASSKDKSLVFKPELCTKLNKIINMLEELMPPGIEFFNVLDKMEEGTGFVGVEHCEALLGVHIMSGKIPNPPSGSFNIPGRVLGVSKPCCPVCHHLLQTLSNCQPPEQVFVTRGTHDLISPCSLPTQLPEDVIRDMNMTFGKQLRVQLTKFIANSKLVRNCTMSATSDRLSLDTLEDHRQEKRADLHEKYEEGEQMKL